MLAEQLAMKVEQSPTTAPQRKDAFCDLPRACATEVDELVSFELEVNAVSACRASGHESGAESQSGPSRKDVVCEGQQKAQPASSELEVNAVLVKQLGMNVEQSHKAVPRSKIRMQTKSPAQEEHGRPRVTFEPLALKDEQSHKAVPQYKRSRELPPRPAPFIRTQTKSTAREEHVTPLDSANFVPKDASRTPSRDIASDPCEGDFEDTFDTAGQTARDGRAMSASCCGKAARRTRAEML